MVNGVKLFVEGGGDKNNKSLRTECRNAFNSFLKTAGFDGHMPRIIACGSRNDAYSDYCTAVANGENAVLLVDSEASVLIPQDDTSYDEHNYKTWKPWYHLANHRASDGHLGDNWVRPPNASDEDCHLMVESMESWLLADIESVKKYYGQAFIAKHISASPSVEVISKDTVIRKLEDASRHTSKGIYDKGAHSFKLLSVIAPAKVRLKSGWADRFITLLSEKMMP